MEPQDIDPDTLAELIGTTLTEIDYDRYIRTTVHIPNETLFKSAYSHVDSGITIARVR